LLIFIRHGLRIIYLSIDRKAESHHTLLTQRNHLLKQAFAVEEENGKGEGFTSKRKGKSRN
jgi:hypothetical protein